MTKIISNLQLRATRQVLNIGLRELSKILKTSKSTISKAELGKTRDFFFKNSAALIEHFEKNQIMFPNEHTIRFTPNVHQHELLGANAESLTRFQLKAARCLLNISQLELAQTIGIDKGIVSRAELLHNDQNINPSDKIVANRIKEVFFEHGIEFPDPFSIFFKKYMDSRLLK